MIALLGGSVRNLKTAALFVVLWPCVSSQMSAQEARPNAPVPGTPPVVAEFLQKVGPSPSAEVFYKQAQEMLWEVYPLDSSGRDSLVAYVRSAPDGPGLGFAGIALIPFHDPNTVQPLVKRVLDPKTSVPTRYCLLNAVPYILAVGDGMYWGEGKVDKETREIAEGLSQLAAEAAKSGLGHAHAVQLRQVFDAGEKEVGEDYGLALWHTSAYLLGTIDLKDAAVLDVFLDPRQGNAFANVMAALSFASNRDFLASLRSKKKTEVSPAMEKAAATAALEWWRAFVRDHPDGDWLSAARAGLHDAGYSLEKDLRSPATQRELLRALDAENDCTRYNAYRILNYIFKTNFDLEPVFFAGKYALSFLDPSGHEKENEHKLRTYWQQRLRGA
jgi:hypothetical protein